MSSETSNGNRLERNATQTKQNKKNERFKKKEHIQEQYSITTTKGITIQSAVGKGVEEPILERFELRREELRA